MKNNWFHIWNCHPNQLPLHHTNKQTEIMKTFTAIYDTKSIKGIQYSFQAKDMESAKIFADWKFDHSIVSNFKIIKDK